MASREIHGSWWVDFSYHGERIRRRSPHNSEAGAAAFEHTLRLRLSQGLPVDAVIARPVPLFADFVIEWMAVYVAANCKPSDQISKKYTLAAHLLPAFGSLRLSQITSREIEVFKAEKIAAGLKRATVNRLLSVLSSCLRRAVEWDTLEVMPRIIPLKSAQGSNTDFLTQDELTRLIELPHEPMDRIMFLCALHTGLRIGELCGLMWEDIDFARNRLTVRRAFVCGAMGTPKSGKERAVPLSDDLRGALAARAQPSGLIFSQGGEPLCRGTVRNIIERSCRQAGVRQVGWHVLRHTFASQLVQRGVPLATIRDLLGHSTIALTERYAHVAPEHLTAAIAALSRPVAVSGPSPNK